MKNKNKICFKLSLKGILGEMINIFLWNTQQQINLGNSYQ